jgi:hypothetical protein
MEAGVIISYEADTLTVRIPVIDKATGGPLDLTGADVAVLAQRSGGQAIVADAAILDAPGGVLLASFVPDTFAESVYALQCRITLGTVTQTVLDERVTIARSLRASA